MRTRPTLVIVLIATAVAAITAMAALLTAVGAGAGSLIAGSGSIAVAAEDVTTSDAALSDAALAAASPVQTNTIFVAITPCRIVDTHLVGQRFSDQTTRNYVVAGSTGFSTQGGNPAGCGIPAAATAIAANITANTASAAGFVRAWPSSVAVEPTATVLNYSAAVNITGGAILAITPNTTQGLTVRNHHGPVDLLIDVTGYYEPQIHGMVTFDAKIFTGSSRILSATHVSTGVYTVTFDSPITNCTAMVGPQSGGSGLYASAVVSPGNTAKVITWKLDATTHKEVLVDSHFYIDVIC